MEKDLIILKNKINSLNISNSIKTDILNNEITTFINLRKSLLSISKVDIISRLDQKIDPSSYISGIISDLNKIRALIILKLEEARRNRMISSERISFYKQIIPGKLDIDRLKYNIGNTLNNEELDNIICILNIVKEEGYIPNYLLILYSNLIIYSQFCFCTGEIELYLYKRTYYPKALKENLNIISLNINEYSNKYNTPEEILYNIKCSFDILFDYILNTPEVFNIILKNADKKIISYVREKIINSISCNDITNNNKYFINKIVKTKSYNFINKLYEEKNL